MICPRCQAAVPDGTRFCPNCGAKIPASNPKQFCTECGAELQPGMRFCKNCGAPVQELPPSSASPRETPHRQEPEQSQQSAAYAPPPQTPPQDRMVCPRCGEPLTVRRKFCVKCGADVSQLWGMEEDHPKKSKQKPKKSAGLPRGAVIAICAVLVVALLASFLLFSGDDDGSPAGSLRQDYDYLCALTSSGTDHYVHARMLTEGLLESDTSVADPGTIERLFERCTAAWKNSSTISQEIQRLADSLSGRVDDLPAEPSMRTAPSSLLITAHADSSGPVDLQSAEESLDTCHTLAAQYASESEAVLRQLEQLRQSYHGRTTAADEWENGVQAVISVMETDLFISGRVQRTEFTSGSPRSVHTLSRTAKSGAAVINGVTTVVNVSTQGSTIVLGENDDGVVMDSSEIGDYLNEGSTVTISSETPEEYPPILFHRRSLSAWMLLDKSGGFTITRGPKGTPEMESGYTDITSPGEDISVNPPPVGTLPPPSEVPLIDRPAPPEPPASPSEPPISVSEPEPPVGAPEDHPGANAHSGKITVRLSWDSHDDLDLHMDTPDESHIYYGRKVAGGGILDVDMNACTLYDDPMENIYFDAPEQGHYRVSLKNFRDRTPGASTRYRITVTIDGVEKVFENEIGDSRDDILIYEFDYGTAPTPPAPPTGSDLDGTLSDLNAGAGPISVSMIWNTQDDLDLHIENPDGSELYYGSPQEGGGVLDIDANSPSHMRMPDPVENIYYPTPQSGHYKVSIVNYCDRTDGTPASYLVRVKVGDNVQEFEGTIDGSSTEIPIVEFDYGDGRSGRIPDDAAAFGDHYYYLFDQSMSWIDAKAFCISQGGHLVTITSPEEQSFLESTFPGSSAWIGGFYSEPDWHWVTGEPMDYTNWKPGEPNFQNGTEWVMHLFTSMAWNDLPHTDTTYHRGFLCEWDHLPDVSIEEMEGALDQVGASAGAITISLGWSTNDDLDLHVFTPAGNEIYFGDQELDGGVMDVDMIPSYGDTPPCVENIFFEDPMVGEYYVYVDQFDDLTDGPSYYLVKVTIGEDVRTFEGTIDEGTSKQVCAFRYNGGTEASPPPSCVSEMSWAGTWDSNWGRMVLTQDGSSVTGRYTHDDGEIRGTVSGNRFEGIWSEPGQSGQVILILSEDGGSFEGDLSFSEDEAPDLTGNGWHGTRTGG